jgi:hypothetical protein
MTLEDVGSVFHAAPNNFIDIRPAARLIATITLRTIEMFGWPSVFPVYRPTGLVSTQYTNTPQQSTHSGRDSHVFPFWVRRCFRVSPAWLAGLG